LLKWLRNNALWTYFMIRQHGELVVRYRIWRHWSKRREPFVAAPFLSPYRILCAWVQNRVA